MQLDTARVDDVEVGNRRIGRHAPVFAIAEAGVNHNGDVALGLELVDAAAAAGADAVKFQTWITESLVARDAATADYQRLNAGFESQFDLLKSLELDAGAFASLQQRAKERGIVFLSTPDEEASADLLEELDVAAFKIGSAEVTNLPFVRHVARKGRPVILSTGMATLDEVAAAVATIEGEENRRLVLLHCVSAYPADPADANLRAMDTLRETFGYPVGFSDHTLGVDVAVAAVARGACVIEKHITLDRSLPGPDHAASLDPAQFSDFVAALRRVESALGDGVKRPVAAELETRAAVRKTLVAARALRQGEPLREEDVVLLRSSRGLPAEELPRVKGRTLARDVAANESITLDALK